MHKTVIRSGRRKPGDAPNIALHRFFGEAGAMCADIVVQSSPYRIQIARAELSALVPSGTVTKASELTNIDLLLLFLPISDLGSWTLQHLQQ